MMITRIFTRCGVCILGVVPAGACGVHKLKATRMQVSWSIRPNLTLSTYVLDNQNMLVQ